jgi:DNA-binding CsgD family transcriptional regulator
VRAAPDAPPRPISAREREVLACRCAGMSNRETAEALFVAQYTVESHARRILRALGCRRMEQACAEFARAERNEGTG